MWTKHQRKLPAAPLVVVAVQASDASARTMSSEATLLVIDDEPSVLATVDRFAHGFGFTVVSRTDARAALAELPVLKPDAVMVDLHGCPTSTGWTCCAPSATSTRRARSF